MNTQSIMVASVSLIAMLGSVTASSAAGWSCSVIEDGKPQVIKIKIIGNVIAVSDWMSRTADSLFKSTFKSTERSFDDKMQIIANSKFGMIAISEPFHSDPGERVNFGARIIVIEKHTQEMILTVVSTAGERIEYKGNCAAD